MLLLYLYIIGVSAALSCTASVVFANGVVRNKFPIKASPL